MSRHKLVLVFTMLWTKKTRSPLSCLSHVSLILTTCWKEHLMCNYHQNNICLPIWPVKVNININKCSAYIPLKDTNTLSLIRGDILVALWLKAHAMKPLGLNEARKLCLVCLSPYILSMQSIIEWKPYGMNTKAKMTLSDVTLNFSMGC